jgi:hypothetical protein
MARIKSGSAAGSQAAKRIGLLDLIHELFDLRDHSPRFADRLEGLRFCCFSFRETNELLAVKLSATVGSVRIDPALPLLVGWAGLVKEGLPALFFDLQS